MNSPLERPCLVTPKKPCLFTPNPTPLNKKLPVGSVSLHRNLDCSHYDSCLYRMAILDPRSWTCWFCRGASKVQEAEGKASNEKDAETQTQEVPLLIPLIFTEGGGASGGRGAEAKPLRQAAVSV